MPALVFPPSRNTVLSSSLRRLYLSSHLRFIDDTIPLQTLSSHYRALLLDSCTDTPSLIHTTKLWHVLESILLRSPKSALPSCLVPTQGGFWDLVRGYTLRGELTKAHSLVSSRLREESDWPTRVASLRLRDGRVDPLAALEHVLEGGEGPSWRRAVMAWAECDELVDEIEIRSVMRLLVGDRHAVKEVARDWLEMFVALVVHGIDLREAVNDAFVMVTSSADFGEPEWRIVKLAIEQEYSAMIELGYREHGAFFAAHFGDILFRKGLIESDVRGHYIRQYCAMLQETRASWRLSVDYLLRIDARQSIDTILQAVPITGAGDPTAEKLFMVAARTGDVKGICSRIAEICRNDGNFGGCMTWLIRGELHDQARLVCEQVLQEAERVGAGSTQATQLAYVVTAMRQATQGSLQNDLLHIYAYHDFQECIMKLSQLDNTEEREQVVRNLCRTAAELLAGLPRSFWSVVVYDTVQAVQASTDGSYMTRNVITELLNGLDSPSKGLQRRLLTENRGVSVDQAVLECRRTLTKLFSSVV